MVLQRSARPCPSIERGKLTSNKELAVGSSVRPDDKGNVKAKRCS